MLSVKEVVAKVARLQTKYSARDQRMRDVLSVRQGDISKVYPAMFSEDYPKPLVANYFFIFCCQFSVSKGFFIFQNCG